ncbi:tRNA dimethylallyltransferase [Melia azedarach]|uniref:tRNA dimethylallyltransferase n=1 Tax=Melia azedarach TaxID=155640 RepID=A0ACC1YA60_MELAZ|nr:tRNA dimethylallyltransferase [Melia azedarach]
MVESFFLGRRMDIHHNHSDPILLLSGPPSCGKTSLLFQFAYNCALESNCNVVFICNRRRLEIKPPFLSQGIDPSSHVFQRIQMKYVEDDEGIKNYFAAFHLHDTFPAAVIVDDFGDLFEERRCQERYANPRGRDLAMVRILALCYNAIVHANEKGPCKLLLSDTHHGNSPRLLFLYKRWISSIFTVRGDGSGSFLLKNNNYSESYDSGRTRTAKYSIALQYLFLEGIIEETER